MRNRTGFLHYNLMLLPAVVFVLIFSIYPMLGIQLAFKELMPTKGIWQSPWVGMQQFEYVFQNRTSLDVIRNTLIIASLKIAAHIAVPVAFALLLNELRVQWLKRTIQTAVYLPYFLSWVILAGVFRDMLSLDGMINTLLHSLFGIEPISFLGSNQWFRTVIVSTDIWKDFGFGAIIYLAALTSINPSLYEAAEIDGASRWQKIRFISIPGILPTVILVSTLNLQNILNAGFDQIFNLYNPLVYPTGDILDTYVYRLGLQQAQYEMGTAVGLFKSAISFVLIVVAYKAASKLANYRIF